MKALRLFSRKTGNFPDKLYIMQLRKLVRCLVTSGLAGFLLAQSYAVYGQPFEYVTASFIAAGRSVIAWCDFDNDNDLDLLICGMTANGTPVTRLYRNDEGVFTDTGLSFIGVSDGAAAWGDYDQDGDMDLLLTGNSETGDIIRLYRNDGDTFSEIDPGIPPVRQGAVCFVDVDNDGDLDIFITGNWMARIYYNKDGEFTAGTQDFGLFSNSSAAWGDFDNDGDLDLLISGDSGAGAITKIFRNDDGIFTDIEAGLPGLMAGTVHWVDYNNDGYLDLAISGFDDALEAQFYIYKNTGGNFEIVYTGIEGFAIGSADWGDFDNDGDLDLIMSGKASGCGAYVSAIYRNEGDDVFYKIPDDFILSTRCAVQWADYDNDGDLDFFIAGLNTADAPFSRLYRNQSGTNIFTENTPPMPPDELSVIVNNDTAHLSWSSGWDGQTPAAGLSYNLMLGTEPGFCDIISPMADPQTGYRYISSLGNAGQNMDYYIQGLESGTYFWTVQSVDQAFTGSAFAQTESFTITTTFVDETEAKPVAPYFYPNPASERITIHQPVLKGNFKLCISDLTGRHVFQSEINERLASVEISNLPEGIYLVQIFRQDEIFSYKLLKTSR